jgi:XTP/dITP diphosphohydrolase
MDDKNVRAMQLYLATANAHKLTELTAILSAANLRAEVFPPSALGGMPPVEEDTGTFEGNARRKAFALAAKLPRGRDVWAVADDSGLRVDALGGAPGVESAYFAGKPTNDAANNAKLLALLHDVPAPRRTAAFHCCIVAATRDGRAEAFTGVCPGRMLVEPRGAGGFGYDPLFVPDGVQLTAAELPSEIKNRISHRARALAQLVAWLRSMSP